ncbi:pyroglutamyl-peptidase I [Streptomyces sp. NBC_00443]|uniref:pyroglutamyl-peptidase I n=1 Tax=Streptomyces sp. NBC_00443 TaxID=2975743 RepID=UPI002E1E9D81
MTRVLLTGFPPFGGQQVNPSWQAVKLVAETPPEGVDVAAVELPCVFRDGIVRLREAIERTEPELVVCVGQAGGRTGLTVERVAVNVADARIPDNAGAQPIDEPVIEGGPTAYFTSLPLKACVAAVREVGVPAAVSNTAGTFVCNHVAYGLAHLIATRFPSVRGGFVHVPWAPEQVLDRAEPSLPVSTMAGGLRALLLAAARTTTDIRVAEGAMH